MKKLGTAATVLIAVLALALAATTGALIATATTDGEQTAVTPASPATTTGVVDADEDGFDHDDRYVDADDRPIPKDRVRRVADAAVAAVGGGTVVEVSRSDDPGETWEVEVMTPGRGEVDVALDAGLRRVPNAAYED